MTITTDGSSYTAWPAAEPAYPVPELATVILVAIGLGGLAAYWGLKRRKLAVIGPGGRQV